MADITVLGSGGFGLALAVMCQSMGHNVTVWSKFHEEIEEIRTTGEFAGKLPGVKMLSLWASLQNLSEAWQRKPLPI